MARMKKKRSNLPQDRVICIYRTTETIGSGQPRSSFAALLVVM